jgi:hypothetical protein
MTDGADVAFAYATYIQARINRTTVESERAVLSRMLDAALNDAISNLISEWTVNG